MTSYRWVLLGGLWTVYFCFGLVAVSMAPLIPAIGSDLGISNATMGIILGAWPLVYIGSAIPCGVLLDRLAPRESLLLGVACVAASAILRGFAEDQVTLFLAVGLFGLGGPLISVGAPKYASQWFEGQSRGLAVGIYTSGPMLGSAAALALTSSWLMPLFHNDWRQVMFVFAGMSVAAGGLWLVISSHSLARGTDSPKTSRTSFSGRILLQILSNPAALVALVIGAGVFFVNHGINNWLPEILRSKGFSAAQSGYWASAATVTGIVALLIVPRLAIPQRRMLIMIFVFSAMLIAFVLLLSSSVPIIALALVLIGVTRASATGVVLLLLMETPGIDAKHHGLLGGVFFVAAEIGGVLGPLTIGLLSSESGGFNHSLLALVAVCGTLVVLTLSFARFVSKS